MTPPGQRYALIDFGRDGLLLDLSSGNLFELNESAALVWASALAGAPASAVAETLANRYALPLATARDDVNRALALDAGTAALDDLDGPYLYARAPGGYLLSRDGLPLLLVDAEGRSVQSAAAETDRKDWPMILQAISPKLLSLRGQLVLHASAVLLDQSIVAFAGKSGAGKTTTGRALAAAGARLLCEDKLLLRQGADAPEAVVDGERRIMSWVAAAAAQLYAGRPAACDALDDAAGGESRPLAAVGFLDAGRRSGTRLAARRLDRAQATRALFSNTFHGSDRPEDWRRHLTIAADATRQLAVYEVTAPQGVTVLEAAAREVIRRGTFAQTAMTAS
jgi:hypothetical protein